MSEALDEIKRRCEAVGLEFVENEAHPEWDDWPVSVDIYFPAGRDTYSVEIEDGVAALWLLGEPFEKYKKLRGFEASWSPEYRVIECNLLEGTSRALLWSEERWRVESVLNKLGLETDRAEPLDPERRIEFDSDTDLSISIGPATTMQGVLSILPEELFPVEGSEEDIARTLTLQVRGVEVTTHDDAVELLERVGNSVLFQIDLSLGLALTLERSRRDFTAPWRYKGELKSSNPLPPVRFEYDREPMSLYWSGKAASAMPLFQFLAYYQVLEFYFPVYSEMEAQRTLRNVVKDPTFDPMRDADVARLLEAIKVGSKGRTFGNEADQLEATIRYCVSADDLRDFLVSEDEDRYKFFTSDNSKKIVRERVSVREKSDDHRGAVAKRIYAIRNRIVHTKGGYEDQEPLLPFDPETKYLWHDIDLVEFLVRKVLIASSRSLQI